MYSGTPEAWVDTGTGTGTKPDWGVRFGDGRELDAFENILILSISFHTVSDIR